MGGPESDYSVCPRPFLRPGQKLKKDKTGTGQDGTGMGQGRDRDGTRTGQGRDGELDNMKSSQPSAFIG